MLAILEWASASSCENTRGGRKPKQEVLLLLLLFIDKTLCFCRCSCYGHHYHHHHYSVTVSRCISLLTDAARPEHASLLSHQSPSPRMRAALPRWHGVRPCAPPAQPSRACDGSGYRKKVKDAEHQAQRQEPASLFRCLGLSVSAHCGSKCPSAIPQPSKPI